MSKNGLLIALLASVASLGSGACSIQNTPHSPTFETDIKPIMLSRCVRCHGAGGTLNADKTSTVLRFTTPPFDGFFDRYEDDCPDGATTACHGLGHYVGMSIFHDYIHDLPQAASQPAYPMPPAPAPRLTSDQLDIIDLWVANGGPQN